MDIQGLLHNKWALGGVGVAAAAGAFALYKRKASTGSTSSTGAQASPGYSAGGVGRFDSTGTDVAAWMGNYSQNLQNQLDEFKKSLTPGTGATIPPAPIGGGGGGGGGFHTMPWPDWRSIGQPVFVQATAGQNVNDWVNSLGVPYGQLDALNPTAWGVAGAPVGIMGNTNSHPDHSLDFFNSDALFRVR